MSEKKQNGATMISILLVMVVGLGVAFWKLAS